MEQIINGLRYDTETAALVASDRWWDGHNFERNGRNTYLYRTKAGRDRKTGVGGVDHHAAARRAGEEVQDLPAACLTASARWRGD